MAHFLKGLEANQRDPWKGENNYHMIHLTDKQ